MSQVPRPKAIGMKERAKPIERRVGVSATKALISVIFCCFNSSCVMRNLTAYCRRDAESRVDISYYHNTEL